MKDIPVGRQIGLGASSFVGGMGDVSDGHPLFWLEGGRAQKEAGYTKPHPNSDAPLGKPGKG